jgi:hypothetical protein
MWSHFKKNAFPVLIYNIYLSWNIYKNTNVNEDKHHGNPNTKTDDILEICFVRNRLVRSQRETGGRKCIDMKMETWKRMSATSTDSLYYTKLPQGLSYTFLKSESIVDIQKLKYGLGIRQFCSLREEKNNSVHQENNFGNSVNCEGESEPACG